MKPSAYISDGGILFKESPPDSILKLNPLYTSAEIQALHNLVKEQQAEIEELKLFKNQMKSRKAMVKWISEESK
jgi:hypothetical protein